MSRAGVARLVALGWLVTVIASCGYGANPATPVLSPTARAVATEVPSSPISSSREQTVPTQTSLIQYATVGDQSAYQFSHYQLRLGADGQVADGPTPLGLPTGLGFSPDTAWPSPTGDYTVLMRPVEPGGIPFVWNRATGKVAGTLYQYGGGSFFGWHPDGRRFLFWIDEVGMWLVDAETLAPVPIAKPHGPVQGAAISPDGKTIAYIADNLPKTLGALWLVSSTGEDVRPPIETGASFLYRHAWSPDGQRLVYYGSCDLSANKQTPSVGGPLCILDLKTQARRPLRVPYTGYEPNWSPDGRHIAATGLASNELPCTQSGGSQLASDTCLYKGQSIYIVDTVTDQVEDVAPGIAPVWSPDGSMLAFLSNRGGAPNVWLYDRVKHESKQLTTDGQAKSPNGQLMWRSEAKK